MAYTYDTGRKHAVKTINYKGQNYQYAHDDNGKMIIGPDFTDPNHIANRTIAYPNVA